MVLGIQWLATLRNIKCNFKELRMEFEYNNKKMLFRGTTKPPVQWVHGKRQVQAMEHKAQAEIMKLSVYPNTGLELNKELQNWTTKHIVLNCKYTSAGSKFEQVDE